MPDVSGNSRWNPFCVVGAQPYPASFVDGTIADPAAPGLSLSGPCMGVPTLLATPSLDETTQGLVDDLTGAGARGCRPSAADRDADRGRGARKRSCRPATAHAGSPALPAGRVIEEVARIQASTTRWPSPRPTSSRA